MQALDKSDPPTVADFFRLAAHKIRQVLLDMAARQRRIDQRETYFRTADSQATGPPTGAPRGHAESGTQTYDGAKLALWTELHNKAGRLPEPERTVFEMHYYLGLPQAEIAKVLDLHPRKVSYLWIAATEELAGELGDGG
jgi:RNA polymerase sigma factor (sigma-70 family)